MEKMTVRFKLNGQAVCYEGGGEESLLWYLRGVKCLKGTKNGCGTGHCGACTVLLGGRAVRACVTRMRQLEGGEVLTIEGLTRDGELHPIQRAFLDVGAIQCGFCTPGMVLAAKALLDKNPDPTPAEITKALEQNYCRCTGYVKIIEAVRLAAARLRGEEPSQAEIRFLEHTQIVQGSGGGACPPEEYRVLGKSLWDIDGEQKAKGTLAYCDDLEPEGLLYGAFVWAPAPRGKNLCLRLERAQAMPGVCRILTGADVPGDNHLGTLEREQEIFCTEEFHFLGDMLALVVGETEACARLAAEAVVVEYEPAEGVFTIEDGLKKGTVMLSSGRETGDVAAARQEDCVVVSGTYEIERVEHGCLEPESALGRVEDGLLTVYATTQSPFEIRRMLSHVMDMDEERLRVVAPPLGGAFGSKCDAHIEAAAAVAAWVLGQPVKITLNRRESLLLSTKRHAYHTRYEVGVGHDGVIRYLDALLCSDAGPYNNLSGGVLMQSCIFASGPYHIPNVSIQGKAVRTNNVLGGAFRGFGINQGAICIETMLDEAAQRLGMDPFELRSKNALRVGWRTTGGEKLKNSVGILDTIALCKELTEKARAEYAPRYPRGDKVLGVGVASGYKNVGVGKGVPDDGGCILTIRPDGRLEMRVSGIDMGQGFRTAMLQICSEATGWEIGKIDVISGDTSRTLRHGQAVSERQTLNSGRAVVEAAAKLKEQCEAEPWRPGETRSAEYYFVAPTTHKLEDEAGRQAIGDDYRNYPAYAYTTQAAIVEVDRRTGAVKVLKVIAVHDVGRAINPHIIEGQIEGSCSMGIGYALQESFPSREGVPTKLHYGKLGLPRMSETPEYEIALVEDPEPLGPFGAKGISEVATVPMTPAVLNAIYDAVGVRIRRLPASPAAILEALRQREEGGAL